MDRFLVSTTTKRKHPQCQTEEDSETENDSRPKQWRPEAERQRVFQENWKIPHHLQNDFCDFPCNICIFIFGPISPLAGPNIGPTALTCLDSPAIDRKLIRMYVHLHYTGITERTRSTGFVH